MTQAAHGLPDRDTVTAIQQSLSLNQTDLDRSKQTVESLSTQQAQLQLNLDKVREPKRTSEINTSLRIYHKNYWCLPSLGSGTGIKSSSGNGYIEGKNENDAG